MTPTKIESSGSRSVWHSEPVFLRATGLPLSLAGLLAGCGRTAVSPPPTVSQRPADEAAEGSDCVVPRTASDLRAEARQLLDPLSHQVTPLLPNRWPEPTGIVVYAYESEPLPTGVVVYNVRGPTARVVFATVHADARIEHLPEPAVLGHRRESIVEDADRLDETLPQAEQVLVETVAGCRTEDSARPALDPYRTWLRIHPTIASDLRRRAAGFLRWLAGGEK